jgi:soluble lytic murein transglycosylase
LPSFTAPPSATPQPAVRIHNADQAFFDGDWEKALVEYQAALANTSEDEVRAEGLLGVARSYLLGRNDYSAIESLENVIAEFPDSRQAASAHFFLAQALNNQERYAEAAQEYQLFLDQRTGAIEAYILNLKGDALFSAGDYSGAEQAYQAVLSAASVLDEIQIRLKLARAYAMAGDYPTALALYDDIYQRTNSDYTRALVDLRKGQAYAELDQLENAQAAYQDAVENFPQTYDAYTALVELIDAGVSVDELQRGIIDYNAGQYGPALSALDHYLQNDPESPALARYYYALTAYAQGNYTEAIRQWDIVIQNYMENPLWADAWEQKAYTQWSNLDLYNDAIETLTTFVEKAPSDPHAAEFLFDAAQVAERDGQFSKAIELYERQASVYPDDEHTPRARFLAALARYRLKDYPAAAEAFKRFEAEAVTLEDKASAGFWLGKALSAAGDADGAQAAWQSAAAIQPTSYYSERARDYTHSRDAFDPPESYDLVFDLQTERRKAADWVKTTFNLPADSDLLGPGDLVNDSYLRRGLELWELGLYDAARGEFEVLRTLSQTDPGKSFRLANLFLDVGAYRPAIMAARQVLNLAGMDDVSSLSAPAYFNHVRFGVYYSDIVMPVAQEYGIHPLFLYALIRQESLFEGFVSSSADARGLMQIMPQTGEEIAANLGWPEDYSADDLYRPNVSLTLGADYLNRQRELFDGDIFAALAAYNGGPGNAAEWIKLAQDDPDLLVEVIRYPETQNYIRRIYENFTIYRMIYNRTP